MAAAIHPDLLSGCAPNLRDAKGSGTRSALRAVAVFEALAKSRKALTLAQLSAVLGTPKSSLVQVLYPLVRTGHLLHQVERYRAGPSLFRLATEIMSAWRMPNGMRPYLEEIVRSSQESVYLGILDEGTMEILCIDSIDSPHEIRSSVPLGVAWPLYCTVAGRALLAYSPQAFQENYLRTIELQPRTEHTISTLARLRAELAQVFSSGISVSIAEMFPDSAAVAAPLFDTQGRLIAAIAVVGPVARVLSKVEDLKLMVATVARRASGHWPVNV